MWKICLVLGVGHLGILDALENVAWNIFLIEVSADIKQDILLELKCLFLSCERFSLLNLFWYQSAKLHHNISVFEIK